MGWDAAPPATGLEVLLRTIGVFTNNVAANDLAKMDLLVKGWRERATRAVALEDLGTGVMRAAITLPESVRTALQDSVRRHIEQLREGVQVKDTVLGALGGDKRGRVQVFVIRPSETLPGSSLENTLQDQQRMYLSGQKDARHFLTWLKEECTRLEREPDSLSVLFRVFSPSGQ
jgi:hypothetical protein